MADLERSLLELCMHIPKCAPNKCPGTSKKVCPTSPCSWKPGCRPMDQYLANYILKKRAQTEYQELLRSRPCSPKPESPRRSIIKKCCADRSRSLSASSKTSNENLEQRPCVPCPVKPCRGIFGHLASNENSQTKLPKETSKKKSLKSKQMSPRPSFSDTCVKKPVCCKSFRAKDCSVEPSNCPPKSCPASPRERTCPASGSYVSPRPSICGVFKPKPCPLNPCIKKEYSTLSKVMKTFTNRPESQYISKPMSPKESISEVCQARPRSPGSERRFSKSSSTSPRLSNAVAYPSESKSQCTLKPLISPCPSISDVCQRSRSCSPRPCKLRQPSSLESENLPSKRKPSLVCAETSISKANASCECTPITAKGNFPCTPTPRVSKSCPPTPCSPTPCSPTPCPPKPSPQTPCSPTPCSPTPKPKNTKHTTAKSASPTKPEKKSASPTKPEEKSVSPKKPDKKSVSPTKPEKKSASPTKPEKKSASPTKPEKKSASPTKPVKSTETRIDPLETRSPRPVVNTEPDPTLGSHPSSHSPVISCTTFGGPSEDCRGSPHCVQFRIPETSDHSAESVQDVKELYFNKDAKKSDASGTWEQCLDEECLQAFESSVLGPCTNAIKADPNSGTHNISQESGASSGSGSACDAARAQYYHTKLLATLQILQNKEDTVRVQAESLDVAEQRIATLTIRSAQLRRELVSKNSELQKMRKLLNPCCEVDKSDASVQTQELETHKNFVKSLQNNLSVIEDLYRECFYETAKQEELIDMLRKSYLDVRLMEKEKIDRIGRLETVINNQKWSLERCQNIAVEVEDLKLEIYNFLTNSNNDSGMWERSEASESLATEVEEDLQDIMEQLVRLRDMLTFDCTCGLKDENKMLKELNENLNMQMGDLEKRTCELECALCQKNKDCKQLSNMLNERDDELKSMRQRLAVLEEREQDRANMCDCLALQLKQTQVILKEKGDELEQLQERNAEYAKAESELRKQLAQADNVIKENCKIRCEVQYLTQQVSQWRKQLADSEARVHVVEEELACARKYCNNIDQCYREKAASATALQEQLEEAHARGAELCAEARRVVCAVRGWVRRMRARDRELEDKIKEQEVILACLQHRLQERDTKDPGSFETQTDTVSTGTNRTTGCSKCIKNPGDETTGHSKCVKNNEEPSCSKSLRRKKSGSEKTSCRCCSGCEKTRSSRRVSESERDSFSSTPVPTRMVLRKKASDGSVSRGFTTAVCETSMPEPQRSASGTCSRLASPPPPPPPPPCCRHRQYHVRNNSLLISPTRALSPSEELFERVERLQEAAEEGQRRWSRSRIPRR